MKRSPTGAIRYIGFGRRTSADMCLTLRKISDDTEGSNQTAYLVVPNVGREPDNAEARFFGASREILPDRRVLPDHSTDDPQLPRLGLSGNAT